MEQILSKAQRVVAACCGCESSRSRARDLLLLLLLPLPLPLRPIPAENSISRLAPRPRFPRPFSRRRLRLPALLQVQCLAATGPAAPAPRWHAALSAAAGLYPAYVAAGASVAFTRPEAFRWFVALAPGSYTATLGFIMLAMGLTLQLSDFAALLRDRPLAVRDWIGGPVSLLARSPSPPVQVQP